ncbi:MAG TPA: hypothetical protein VH561_13755 [Micromonosporaceae bacterium]|jgi:hypothetical protein
MLVAVGSVKGSPGATTWALAVAARWPYEAAPVVVELDASGGDVGSRFGVHDVPGLSSLVTAVRHAPIGDAAEYAQPLPTGAQVIVAPPADAAAATTAEFTTRGPAVLRELAAHRPVFADLGRLDPASPALSYLDKADELLLVVRPVAAQLRHLKARLGVLAGRCALVRLVLVGPGPYGPDEIAIYTGVPVAAVVPDDPVGAGILAGSYRPGRGWLRRPLLAAARTFALTYPAPETADHEVALG